MIRFYMNRYSIVFSVLLSITSLSAYGYSHEIQKRWATNPTESNTKLQMENTEHLIQQASKATESFKRERDRRNNLRR